MRKSILTILVLACSSPILSQTKYAFTEQSPKEPIQWMISDTVIFFGADTTINYYYSVPADKILKIENVNLYSKSLRFFNVEQEMSLSTETNGNRISQVFKRYNSDIDDVKTPISTCLYATPNTVAMFTIRSTGGTDVSGNSITGKERRFYFSVAITGCLLVAVTAP